MKIIPLLLFAVLFSNSALAIDMDFYTVGQAGTLELTFKSVALFFNHSITRMFLITAFTVGLGFGILQAGSSAFMQKLDGGDGGIRLSPLAWSLVGLAVFSGFFLPTATLHIYDSARNQYKPVPNVPQMIVLAAGLTNNIERNFNDVVNSSNPNLYDVSSSGLPFQLVYFSTAQKSLDQVSKYLRNNIEEYNSSCVSLSNVDQDKIYLTSTDVYADLSIAAKPGWYTTWYDNTSANGTTVSCLDAYTRIGSETSPTSDSVTKMVTYACKQSQFDTSDAAEFTACKTLLNDALNNYLGTPSGFSHIFRTNLLAHGIRDSLLNGSQIANIKELANRRMMQDGFASIVVMTDWLPVIKAILLSVVLSATVIIAFLFPTPLFPKAIKLMLGLWTFIMAWNVMDMLLLQQVNANAKVAFDSIKDLNVGLQAIMSLPDASQQALTIMAEARQSAPMQMAMIITATFTGVSAYGLASVGQSAVSSAQGNADRAANDSSPEGKGQVLDSLTNSSASVDTHSNHDFSSMVNSNSYGQRSEIAGNTAMIEHNGGVNNAVESQSKVVSQNAVESQSKAEQVDAKGTGLDIASISGGSDGAKHRADIEQRNKNGGAIENAELEGGMAGTSARTQSETIVGLSEENNTTPIQVAETQGQSSGGAIVGNAIASQEVAEKAGSTVADDALDQQLIDVAKSAGALDSARSDADNKEESLLDSSFGLGALSKQLENENLNLSESLIEAISEGSNKPLNQALQDFVVAERASDVAAIEANGGDVGEIIDNAIFKANQEIGNIDGQQSTYKENGTDVKSEAEKSSALDAQRQVTSNAEYDERAKNVGQTPTQVVSEEVQHDLQSKYALQQSENEMKQELMDANDGMTEQQAADVLAHYGDAGKRAEFEAHGWNLDSIKQDREQQAEINKGTSDGVTVAIAEQGVGAVDFARDKAHLETHEQAEQTKLMQDLSAKTGVSTQDLVAAETGANNHMTMTPEMAAKFFDSGLINKDTLNAANDSDGGRIDFSLARDEEGNAVIATSSYAGGESTSINNQDSNVDGNTTKTGSSFADPSSARTAITDVETTKDILSDESQGNNDYASAYALAMSGLYEAQSQTTNAFNIGGSVNAGDGGEGVGNGGSASASVSNANTAFESSDKLVGTALEFIDLVNAKADNAKLYGDEREDFVAEQLVSFSQKSIDAATDNTKDNAKGYNNIFNDIKHDLVKDMNQEYPHNPEAVQKPEPVSKEQIANAQEAFAKATLENSTNVKERISEGVTPVLEKASEFALDTVTGWFSFGSDDSEEVVSQDVDSASDTPAQPEANAPANAPSAEVTASDAPAQPEANVPTNAPSAEVMVSDAPTQPEVNAPANAPSAEVDTNSDKFKAAVSEEVSRNLNENSGAWGSNAGRPISLSGDNVNAEPGGDGNSSASSSSGDMPDVQGGGGSSDMPEK